MSPVIQATVALNFSTLVGVVSGYYLRAFSHRCPKRGPFVRVPDGAHLKLTCTGVQLLEDFAVVDGGGTLTVEAHGDGWPDGRLP